MRLYFFCFLLGLGCTGSVFAQENDSSAGFLKLITNAERTYIIVDQDFSEIYELSSEDSIALAPGLHEVLFVTPQARDYLNRYVIKSDSTITVERTISFFREGISYAWPALEAGFNFEFITDPNSRIFLDGEYVSTGVYRAFLKNSEYTISSESPRKGGLKATTEIKYFKINQLNRYNEFPTRSGFFMRALPGNAYRLRDDKRKFYYTIAGLSVLGGLMLNERRVFNSARSDYDNLTAELETIFDPVTINRNILGINRTVERMDASNQRMTYYSIGALLFYGLTTWHGNKKPKSGYRVSKRSQVQLSTQFNPDVRLPELSLTVSLK